MRILSARIGPARLLRDMGEVEAVVTLVVKHDDGTLPLVVRVAASSPARAPGAAPLRERLLAQAKLAYATGRIPPEQVRRAA